MRMSTKSDEFVNSIVRTSTAIFVGAVITYLVANAFNINNSLKIPLDEVIFGGVSIGYYVIVRVLERYVNERFGWLLFSAGNPTYPSVKWNDPEDRQRVVDRKRTQPTPHRANLHE